jgi:RNA polymerase sigma factor (sigma-70 family)
MTQRHSTTPETAPAPNGADRDALIMRHAKLVRSIARRYTGRGLAYDDIVQSGYIGLIQAVDRFDPSRGVPLRSPSG